MDKRKVETAGISLCLGRVKFWSGLASMVNMSKWIDRRRTEVRFHRETQFWRTPERHHRDPTTSDMVTTSKKCWVFIRQSMLS